MCSRGFVHSSQTYQESVLENITLLAVVVDVNVSITVIVQILGFDFIFIEHDGIIVFKNDCIVIVDHRDIIIAPIRALFSDHCATRTANGCANCRAFYCSALLVTEDASCNCAHTCANSCVAPYLWIIIGVLYGLTSCEAKG